MQLHSLDREEPEAAQDQNDMHDLFVLCERDPEHVLDLLVKELIETPNAEKSTDNSYLNSIAIHDEGHMLTVTGAIPTVVRLMRDLHASGIEEDLQTVGWHTVMHIESSDEPAIVKTWITPKIDMR